MAGYLYGTYGRLGESVAQSPVQSTTVPCYIGTAPVNLVKGYADKEIVNKPIKLTTLSGARTTIGYSDDWGAFTLSEVIAAHFNNSRAAWLRYTSSTCWTRPPTKRHNHHGHRDFFRRFYRF